MNEDNARLVGGTLITVGILAAEHWIPWWRELTRIEAYVLGTIAILLGQGGYLRFNRRWTRLCMIACAGGITVIGAYHYDTQRRARAAQAREQVVAGGQHNGASPTN